MAEPVRPSYPQSKAASTSKFKLKCRVTRSASHAFPPIPIVESEDSVDNTGELPIFFLPSIILNSILDVAVDEDIIMSHVVDTERQTNVTIVTPSETINQLTAMASANDLPADQWVKETNNNTSILLSP